jgi:lactate permease
VWIQQYDPLSSWVLSTCVAASPVLVLLVLLATGWASAPKAALAGLLTACAVALGVFGMPPRMVLASAAVGVVFALFRIVWLIVAAVFLYDITVMTGQFEIMKASVARLAEDRRLQAVLVAFSFGAFIEGAAGFGAPVAISAAFLVGLGFRPFQAALLCLIANTAPVAWGSIGIPLYTLSQVTGLDVQALSATCGRILPFMSLVIPFWLVRTMTTSRETLAVWFPLAVIGGAFASVQFLWSNYVGYELVDIVAAVASMAAGIIVIPLVRRSRQRRFEGDGEVRASTAPAGPPSGAPLPGRWSSRQIARAWMPFALLSVAVLFWGIPASPRLGTPAVKQWLDSRLSWKPEPAWLHKKVAKGAAVTGHQTPEPGDFENARIEVVPLSATGTAVFLAAVASGFALGVSPKTMAGILAGTLRRMSPAFVAILSMLALGFVTKYSGMDAVLGLAFTRAGPLLYPVFGTLLGWLGVALTGSDTSSNVLFGNLQKITAMKLGLDPYLMASANSTGGVMGKMIDAQSIVVAAAATGEGGREGALLRAVFWHSIMLAFCVAAIVWVYAHLLPGAVVAPSAAP